MNLQKTLATKLSGREINNGHYYACWCPFDSHKSPALLLYSDYYICMSCGARGYLPELKRKLGSNVSIRRRPQESKILPRWKNWERKYGDLEGIAHAGHNFLKSMNRTYLKKRQLDQFFEQGMFGMIDGWLTIPVFNSNHKVIDIVVRGIRNKGDVKYVICPYTDTDVRPLYIPNWERVNSSMDVYIPFGIFDAWAFEAIGLASATGITGKSISEKSLEVLKYKNKIIVPDDDEWDAAYKLAHSIGSLVSVKRLPYLPYDGTYKDPDEFRRNLSEIEWKGIINAT